MEGDVLTIIKNALLDIVFPFFTIAFGGTSLYLLRENKELKKTEVKEKQTDVVDKQQHIWANQNEEYKEIIALLKDERDSLRKKNAERDEIIQSMTRTQNEILQRVGALELKVEQVDFFRCNKLECVIRDPPLGEKKRKKLECLTAKKQTDENV